jgi:hypothetical protein
VQGKNHRPKKKPTVSVKNRGRSITIPCAACGQEFVVYENDIDSVRVCREYILSHYSDKEVPNARNFMHECTLCAYVIPFEPFFEIETIQSGTYPVFTAAKQVVNSSAVA